MPQAHQFCKDSTRMREQRQRRLLESTHRSQANRHGAVGLSPQKLSVTDRRSLQTACARMDPRVKALPSRLLANSERQLGSRIPQRTYSYHTSKPPRKESVGWAGQKEKQKKRKATKLSKLRKKCAARLPKGLPTFAHMNLSRQPRVAPQWTVTVQTDPGQGKFDSLSEALMEEQQFDIIREQMSKAFRNYVKYGFKREKIPLKKAKLHLAIFTAILELIYDSDYDDDESTSCLQAVWDFMKTIEGPSQINHFLRRKLVEISADEELRRQEAGNAQRYYVRENNHSILSENKVFYPALSSNPSSYLHVPRRPVEYINRHPNRNENCTTAVPLQAQPTKYYIPSVPNPPSFIKTEPSEHKEDPESVDSHQFYA